MERRNGRACIIGAVAVSALTGLQCTGPVAGTITQSGNGIVSGSVVDSGAPVSGARVLLIPAWYDPVADPPLPDSLTDTTGSSGEFRIIASARNDYNVFAEAASGKNALLTGISFADGDTETTASLTLTHPGYINVVFGETPDADSAYVYIPGTPFSSVVRGGAVLLERIPQGTVPEVRYCPGVTGSETRVINENIPVASGDTTTIADYSRWGFAKRIHLNTSASGAGISGSVTDFPLLVRLTSDNFDFRQAEHGGADIRFTKADGEPLAYEIERWDAAGQRAEIWVRIDTVHGNDTTRSLMMYWGNENAVTESNPRAVFDTTNGFAGVWHLGEPDGAIVPDATGNGNNGTAVAAGTVTGMIGTAQSFDGETSLIRVSGQADSVMNFQENDSYTVSAWVRTTSRDSLYQGIVYKSNFQYGLQIRPESTWEFFTFVNGTGWEASRAPVTIDSWHFLTGVRRGNRQYLHVDGVCVDSAITVVGSNLSRSSSGPLEIGHCPDGGVEPDRFFSGGIDEVRILRIAATPDWIKLCYMNQKEPDALVKW